MAGQDAGNRRQLKIDTPRHGPINRSLVGLSHRSSHDAVENTETRWPLGDAVYSLSVADGLADASHVVWGRNTALE